MSSFTFNATIPAAQNNPSNDQPIMLDDNIAIQGWSAVDHVGYNVSPGGTHNQVNLATDFSSGAPPLIGTCPGNIYGATVSGLFNLFFQNASKKLQLTNVPFNTSSNSGTAGGTLFFFDTPWNIRFYMGVTNAFAGTGRTVVFPSSFGTIYFWNAIANDPNPVTVSAVGRNTGLTLATSNSVTVEWFAVGR